MKRTNNSIEIKVEKCNFMDVPVIRNGKPTKGARKKLVTYEVIERAIGIEVEGHEVFVIEKELLDDTHRFIFCYDQKGEILTCNCQYGAYGKAGHLECLYYNKATNTFIASTNGYQGATGRGWGSRIISINF